LTKIIQFATLILHPEKANLCESQGRKISGLSSLRTVSVGGGVCLEIAQLTIAGMAVEIAERASPVKAWRAKFQVFCLKCKTSSQDELTGTMTAELPKKVNPVKAGGAKLWACTLPEQRRWLPDFRRVQILDDKSAVVFPQHFFISGIPQRYIISMDVTFLSYLHPMDSYIKF
jgi:hypothetical protein